MLGLAHTKLAKVYLVVSPTEPEPHIEAIFDNLLEAERYRTRLSNQHEGELFEVRDLPLYSGFEKGKLRRSRKPL